MRRQLLAVVVAVLVSVVGLSAVENSVTFMPLVSSPQFLNRVTYLVSTQAPVVLTEASTGTYNAVCHARRYQLAQLAAAAPAAYSGVFAITLVTNINVTSAGALTGAGATLDTPATDAALFAALSSVWSQVAGCVTNP